jgi:hypothetical protein
MYDKLHSSKTPADRSKYLQGLSDDDLELLTEAVYGTRTSDPDVVQARIAVAHEMGKRGLDIKKYGALGGGPTLTPRKLSPMQHAAVTRARAQASAKPTAPPASPPAAKLPTNGFKTKAV